MFAFVRGATDAVTLPDVLPTPATSVTDTDGKALPWADSGAGIRVELVSPGGGPYVIRLGHVTGRASA